MRTDKLISVSSRGPVFLLLVLMAAAVPAAGPDYLLLDHRLCDPDKTFCLRGTLSYEPNPRLLRLRARVQIAPGPGLLRIMVTGTNRLGYRRYAPFEVRVRGTYSEIIDHKMIPDYPDVYAWEIDRVEFVPDEVNRDDDKLQ